MSHIPIPAAPGERTPAAGGTAAVLYVWIAALTGSTLLVSFFHFVRGTPITGLILLAIAAAAGVQFLLRLRLSRDLLVNVSVVAVSIALYAATFYTASVGSRGGQISIALVMLGPLFMVLVAITGQRWYQLLVTIAGAATSIVLWLEWFDFPAIAEARTLFRVIGYPTLVVMAVLSVVIAGAVKRMAVLTDRLRAGEERYRSVFDGAMDAVILHTFDGLIIDANEAACLSYGYSRSELVGLDISNLAVAEDGPLRVARMSELERGSRGSVTATATHKSRTGRLFPVEVQVTVAEVDDERYCVATIRDTTEQRRREQQISFQARVLDTVAQSIAVVDRDGHPVYVNRHTAEFTGLEAEELLRVNLVEAFVPEADRARANEVLAIALSGRTWSNEITLHLPYEGDIPVLLVASPVEGDTGDVEYVILLAVNIAERKKMERELREATYRAEEAAASKSIFLASMSHEIRTPLNGIIGFAELLSDNDPREDQVEPLQHLVESGKALLTILSDVLSISKLDSGRYQVQSLPFELEPVVAGIDALYRPEAEEKQLDLVISGANSVPPTLEGDPDRIRQILGNLVSNAIKYTDDGSISVRFAWEAGRLRVAVADTGIGIAEHDIDRLFELFEQLDYRNSRSGTGLGLAITKRLVESLGGSIHVESELGVGSTFTCVLPMSAVVEATPLRASSSRDTQDTRDTSGASFDILVVEDDRINMLVADKMLSSLGHRVTQAENGAVALERVGHDDFDLVFMDYHMPVMDGLEATARIRELGGNRPVIVGLSASVFGEDRAAMFSAGMDEVITKPITKQVVLDTIERMTARRVPEHSAS